VRRSGRSGRAHLIGAAAPRVFPIDFKQPRAFPRRVLRPGFAAGSPPRKIEGGGDAGEFPFPTDGCTRRVGLCRRFWVFPQEAGSSPAPHALRFFQLPRNTPDGLTFLSIAAGSVRARRLGRVRRKNIQAQWRAAGSPGSLAAAAMRLSALRSHPQPPLPARTSNTPRDVPLVGRDRRNRVLLRTASQEFILAHSSWPGLTPKSGLPDLGISFRTRASASSVPIHVLLRLNAEQAWMPATSAGMTTDQALILRSEPTARVSKDELCTRSSLRMVRDAPSALLTMRVHLSFRGASETSEPGIQGDVLKSFPCVPGFRIAASLRPE
jgi:hypothetical protein